MKLKVIEFTMSAEEAAAPVKFDEGYKYSYFYDEETGKYYSPKENFELEIDDIDNNFFEVEYREEN